MKVWWKQGPTRIQQREQLHDRAPHARDLRASARPCQTLARTQQFAPLAAEGYNSEFVNCSGLPTMCEHYAALGIHPHVRWTSGAATALCVPRLRQDLCAAVRY